MQRAEEILNKNIDLLHKLSGELLEREILDSYEIEKIIKGEELPPIKKNGSAEGEKQEDVPDHVKKLLEQRKSKETSPKDDSN
jgi:cell division protease FtsH